MKLTQPIVGKENHNYVILIAAAAALGGFLFGFDTAVITVVCYGRL